MSELDALLERAESTAPTGRPSGGETGTSKSDAPKPGVSAENADNQLPRADRYITALYITLCVISIIELYSASSREVSSGNIFGPIIRHCIMLAMGIAICFGVSRVRIRYFKPLTPVFVAGSVLMMVYVLLAGDIINGARRSFTVAGIQIQPAEFLKISSVLIIAFIMARNQVKGGVRDRALVWCGILVIVFGGLLFTQGMTNTILLMGISLSMVLLSGVRFKKFVILIVAYAAIALAGMQFKADRSGTWKARIDRFNDTVPLVERPITADNRQEMYAYMAQANGGIIGVFPGNSRETARLPLAFSDYIYSIIVEDLGFVGGIFILLIYLSLLARAGTIAARCDRAFPAMLVMGMAVMIALQALFHMAIVTGVFPVSGQPLPMLSKGGTSILVTSLAFGIMLSVSRYATTAGRRKAKKLDSELPDDMDAVNPAQLKR